MAICENCGTEYDEIEANDEFNNIYRMDNDNIIQDMFGQDLCFECASFEIESQGNFEKCDNCGKRFDVDEAERDFECEYGTSLNRFGHFNERLCFECAKSAWEDREYYDECENCGTRFHVGDADSQFENECGDYGLVDGSRSDISDLILCADCALNVARERYEEYQKEHPEYFNDDENEDHEGFSVYEAADIWASNGKDEDYMFGYTEDELEDAL